MIKLLMLFGLVFLVSCSDPPEQTSVNTSFVFTSGLSALETQTGGIILYGKNKDNPSDAFTMVIDGDAKSIEINNGAWEFMAVSWTGYNANLGTYGNPFEGVVRCSKIPNQVFTGGDTELSFVLDEGTCRDSDFGLAETRDSTGPKLSKFYSCTNEEAFSEHQDYDGIRCFNSIGNSFQVVLMSRSLDGGMEDTYKSRCIANNHAGKTTGEMNSVQAHQLRLPIFFPDYPGPLWSVRVFEDGGCNTQNSSSIFVHPYAGETIGRKAKVDTYDEDTHNTFLVYTPVCGSVPGQQATPFTSHLEYYDEWDGVNVSEQYKVICTKEQMANFMTSNSALNYKLGRSIDFGGSTYSEDIIGGVFTGTFIGSGHTLSNFNISAISTNNGLFSEISSGAVVKGLNIDGVTINCTGATNVGAFAGKVTSGHISNINVSNIDIDVNGCSYVGGMVGYADGLYGGPDSEIQKLNVNNLTMDISGEATANLGGGFGYYSGDLQNSKYSNISIQQSSAPVTPVVHYGGVFGQSEFGSFIRDIVATGISMGSSAAPIDNVDSIGGVFGLASEVSEIRSIQSVASIFTGANSVRTGGVFGALSNSGNEVSNILSSSNIQATGEYVGGIMGYSTGNGSVRVLRSFGSISCNNYCGGIVGSSINSDYRMLYSGAQLSPSVTTSITKVGGIAGLTSGNDKFSGAQNDGDILFPYNGSTPNDYIGGIIGYHGGTGYLNYLINHGDIQGAGVGIGGIVGYIADDTSASLGAFLNSGTITNDTGSSYHLVGGFTDSGSIGLYDAGAMGLYSATGAADALNTETSSTEMSSINLADTSTLPGFSPEVVEGNGTDPLELKAVYRLKSIGGGERLGNRLDPFLISSATQWNMIEDEPIFMDGYFELVSEIDFSGVTFKSIGSTLFPFKGSFRGNNFGLNNIDINYAQSVEANYTGTVSINVGTNAVTGTSTSFSTELTTGEGIEIGGQPFKVSQIISDTSLIVEEFSPLNLVSENFKPFQDRNVGIFAATKHAMINTMFDEGDEYEGKLYIRNLNLDVTATIGETHVGGLVGHMTGHNSLRKIEMSNANINVVPTGTDGAYVGGLVGLYDLKSDWGNYWSYLDVFDSTITGSGGGSTYVGGVLGQLNAVAETSGGAYHEFRTLRVRDTSISGFGTGGIAYSVLTDTMTSLSFEELLVSSTTGSSISSSSANAGGLFGKTDAAEIRQFAVKGYDISSDGYTDVGGAVGAAYGSEISGGYVSSKVSTASGNVGCMAGAGFNSANNGQNLSVENSYAYCSEVINVSGSGNPESYFVADTMGLNTPVDNNVFYIGPFDEAISGVNYISEGQLFDEGYMSVNFPNFQNGDPWFWPDSGIGQPVTVMEFYPQYFFE